MMGKLPKPPEDAYRIEAFPYVGDTEFRYLATCTVEGCTNNDGNPYRSGLSPTRPAVEQALTAHWRTKHMPPQVPTHG